MPSRFSAPVLDRLIALLEELRTGALELERSHEADVESAAPSARPSARNLLHYLSLRQHDLRDLQLELAHLGLSSLGRTEACTLAGLEAVLGALYSLTDRTSPEPFGTHVPLDHVSGPTLLEHNAEALLGPQSPGRKVRIMVTAPSEAASDYGLVRGLLAAGMNSLRINAAHDGRDEWAEMARHLRRARSELARPCRLHFDLAGPKLRTGAIGKGLRVVHMKPRRGLRGEALAAARVWLADAEHLVAPPRDGAPADAVLPIQGTFVSTLRAGDRIELRDARDRKIRLDVLGAFAGGGAWAESWDGAYVESSARVELRRDGRTIAHGSVGWLPLVHESVLLRPGDRFILVSDGALARPAVFDEHGALIEPAQVPCTLPEIFRDVHTGERIWLDDGRIGGVVASAHADRIEIDVTQALPHGSKLGADKSINLPDTDLHLEGMTPKDLADLEFACAEADLVGLSFVRSPDDVVRLERELGARAAQRLGVVLKIETRQAFERLPRLLLTGMRTPPLGVMVARGDLAVEMGFERLAEVQEEILWLCEAAHVPVIWATQVLESLAKTGIPSRAEVTDAAMSVRAECVMLNKGPHIERAVHFLDNVLLRMKDHHQKKRSMLRRLAVSTTVG
jgi:pyruvate kinase